eukprot:CAMPEP_0119013456 /NCGR_PEP_ID=MMETSP1176-20130426/8457_1 /TAXON_ID=265551 /ORGANISM="Synedropsis recta cf, Strain CCMP1620" /LENGTH=510 /DNA_ID=CAMNT_0006966547 /DNA_START=139 /DNA_END=1671 /DNA_ORIENTATION=+
MRSGSAAAVKNITHPVGRRRPRRLNRRADMALIVILCTLSAVSMIYNIYSTSRLLELQNYHSHMDHLMTNHVPHTPVPPERMALERRWQRTVKSCLPTLSPKVCGLLSEQYTRAGGAGSVANAHRVALIAPPGDFSNWIFAWISEVMNKVNQMGSTTHMHIELLSHVPPYSHGFAKVIRVLPQSLLLGASDALRSTLTLGKTQQVLRFDDLKAAMRLLLRYHCRISQMASHTPVFTLEMDTVSNTPRVAHQGLLNFLNITAMDHGERSREELELEDFEDSEDTSNLNKASERETELMEMSRSLRAYASSLLTWIQKAEHVHLKKELNLILQEELESSNDFAECHSFWTVGEGAQGLDMSVFSRALATTLVPDCTSEKCTHPRDFCEEKGDASCFEKPAYPSMKLNGMQLKAKRKQEEEGNVKQRGNGHFVKSPKAAVRHQQGGVGLLQAAHRKDPGSFSPQRRTTAALFGNGKLSISNRTTAAAMKSKLRAKQTRGDLRQNNMKWSHWAG